MSDNKSKYEIDMCNGPLIPKILVFSLLLIASGILQLLFNAADMIVAGRYAGSVALAAIGSTSSLINLLINLFVGLSVGANVAIAHFYGAKRYEELSDALHTAIVLSLLGGVFLAIVGFVLARPLLSLMGTPIEVIDHSVAYMKIYFLGMPATLLYNFGSSILRAVGDTKRPLIFLSLAGVVNIILNLIFVIVFNMGVSGVALATIISQIISAGLVFICLMKNDGPCKLVINKLKLHKKQAIRIIRIGLPAGLQGAIFSVSNVLIQSSVNSFGATAVAGNTASCNVEGFVYNSMNAIYQTAISFVSQNIGAKKFDRIKRTGLICMVYVFLIGAIMGGLGLLFSVDILSIYSTEEAVIWYGVNRMKVIFMTYFLCGMMDVCVGIIRGMGFSVMPMIVSLLGACAFRIVWIFTIFRHFHSLKSLYVSYPISWVLTMVVHLICLYFVAWKKVVGKSSNK